MASFDEFKADLIEKNSAYAKSSDAHLRNLWNATKDGAEDQLSRKTSIKQIRSGDLVQGLENRHGTLNAVAASFSFIGWLVVSVAVIAMMLALKTLSEDMGSLSWMVVLYALAIGVMGLLVVASGQVLKVFGQIEQNTQKTYLLLLRNAEEES